MRKASIGVQCRRDKTLSKTVTLSTPGGDRGEEVVKPGGSESGVGAPRRCMGYSMANPLTSLEGQHGYKFGGYMMLEVYPNGGGKVLHMWQVAIAEQI